RLRQLAKLVDEVTLSDDDRREAERDLPGFKPDDRPGQWVDRLIRDVELQAASVRLTPADDAALRSALGQRLADPAEADRLFQRVKKTFDSREGAAYFTTVTFEYGGEASLSWYLTEQERAEIIAETARLDRRIELLLDWWQRP